MKFRALISIKRNLRENWYHYQNPLVGEISERVKKTYEFIEQNKQKGCTSIVISYSWNEHSEGGAINPTMGSSPDYRPNTRWLGTKYSHLPLAQILMRSCFSV